MHVGQSPSPIVDLAIVYPTRHDLDHPVFVLSQSHMSTTQLNNQAFIFHGVTVPRNRLS
jgi:hypothetical protein